MRNSFSSRSGLAAMFSRSEPACGDASVAANSGLEFNRRASRARRMLLGSGRSRSLVSRQAALMHARWPLLRSFPVRDLFARASPRPPRRTAPRRSNKATPTISAKRSSTKASFRSRRTARITSSPGTSRRRSISSAPPKGALRIERFSYTLTPTDDGRLDRQGRRLPEPGLRRADGQRQGDRHARSRAAFAWRRRIDAAQTDFLRSLLSADTLAAKFHVPDGARGDDLDLAESGHIGRDPRQDVRQRRRRRRRPRPIGQEPDRNRRRAAAGRSGPARRGDVYGRRLRRRRGDLGTARA